jgi:NADPH:quinone reductase-like Zn-dependent oxidoreductase
MPSNRAAWISSAGSAVAVGPAEMPTPTPNTLIIANRAVAINPVDWKQASSGLFIRAWPTILGCDTAGTVHSVGSGVAGFKVGDRVLAHCIGVKSGEDADEAFQLYSRVPVELACVIPEDMAFEDAAVVPLGLSTAAAGLYEAQHLGLPLPLPRGPSETETETETEKVVLVWGGSSSVGSSAIQLAVASGFAVVTTASEHNFGFCKGLGATRVFDHRSGSVVSDIVDALKQREFAGAYDGTLYTQLLGRRG